METTNIDSTGTKRGSGRATGLAKGIIKRRLMPTIVAAVAASIALAGCATSSPDASGAAVHAGGALGVSGQGGHHVRSTGTATAAPSTAAASTAAVSAGAPAFTTTDATSTVGSSHAITADDSVSSTTPHVVTAAGITITGHPKGISLGGNYQNTVNAMSANDALSTFQDMRSAGVQWVRLDYNYGGNTTWHGGASDQTIRAARTAGLNVDIVFGDGTAVMPMSAGYRAPNGWMTAAVQRLAAGGIHWFEIGNEANLANEWNGARPNPAAYVQLLKAVYPIIHSADPQATVLMSGMAPYARQVAGSGPQGNNYNPIDFIRQMYWAGAHGSFDAVNLHPYTYPAMPAQADGGYNTLSVLPDLITVMKQYGDGNMPIWWTESGAPTGSDAGYPAFSVAQQQETIKELFQVAAQYPQTGPVFLFDWQDNSQDGDFGLYTWNHQRKASFATFASVG